MDRREFVKYSGTTLLGTCLLGSCNKFDEELGFILPKCDNPLVPESSSLSKQFRIIMNNDGNDGFHERFTKKFTNESDFLNFRTTPLMENSHVDAIFYCTGTTHIFSHQTTYGENFYNNFLNSLHRKGTDPLRLVINHVRNYDKQVFFSLRMNDTHDSTAQHIFPEWKTKYEKYLMGSVGEEFPYGGNRWSAMNYEHDEVRHYILALLEEVIQNYEINGIELDFFRHPIFFRNQLFGKDATIEQLELMNTLIEEISSITHQNNLQLAIRIPDSLTVCYKIGLDINTWLCNQWVDITSLSGYFHLEPWSNIKLLKEVFDTQVYACLSRSRLKYFDNKTLPDEFWRGEGIIAKNAGADGIYFFNVFDPYNPLFYELGDVDLMQSKHKRLIENEGFYHNYWVKDCSNYSQI
jgi:hypothetical protein